MYLCLLDSYQLLDFKSLRSDVSKGPKSSNHDVTLAKDSDLSSPRKVIGFCGFLVLSRGSLILPMLPAV